MLKLLAQKPEGTKEDFQKKTPETGDASQPKKKNPFLPPYEEGQHIDDLAEHHALIFNKYSVCERHVIVITKEFEMQTNPLNKADFKAVCMTMSALSAFSFFNSGFNAGASIPHKHV